MGIKRIRKIVSPFLRESKKNILLSFALTLFGALLAQVNPIVFNYIIKQLEGSLNTLAASNTLYLYILLAALILFFKDVLDAVVLFYQSFLGETIKAQTSKSLFNYTVDKVVYYSPAFFCGSK